VPCRPERSHPVGSAPCTDSSCVYQDPVPGKDSSRGSSQGRMTRILERTDFHAAPTPGAKVVVDIYGILDDHCPVPFRASLDGFNARMGHCYDERMASDLEVEGSKLEV